MNKMKIEYIKVDDLTGGQIKACIFYVLCFSIYTIFTSLVKIL